jgi:hypothetical protein
VVIRYLLCFVVVILCSEAIAQRPIPNVITGGNPYKKDVPWPESSTGGGSTFYKRAHRTYYNNYIRTHSYCAAHRSSFYGNYQYSWKRR